MQGSANQQAICSWIARRRSTHPPLYITCMMHRQAFVHTWLPQQGNWMRVSESAGRGLDLQEHDNNPVSAAGYISVEGVCRRRRKRTRVMYLFIRSRYLSKAVVPAAPGKLIAANQSNWLLDTAMCPTRMRGISPRTRATWH